MKLIKFFPYKKALNFPPIFLLCFLWSRYGTGTLTGNWNRNRNFLKVGTGTVKNNHGSTTLLIDRHHGLTLSYG
jgi:hypothetical protein